MDLRILGALALALAPLAGAAADAAAIGDARPVAGLESAAGVNAAMRWAALDDGSHVAVLRIASAGAKALRVGLRIGDLDPSARLRFYAPDEVRGVEVPAASILDALARNRAAGESGPDARTWWSPLVKGATLVVEIELPPGADPGRLRVAVPLVSHIRDWPVEAGRAVAIATRGGTTRECPGALVAGAGGTTAVFYLVTGSDCVGTQSAASSLQAFWPQASSGVGARLLYASSQTGTAFVALDAPPAGAASLALPAVEASDPALEQWIGRAASRAVGAIDTFSSP